MEDLEDDLFLLLDLAVLGDLALLLLPVLVGAGVGSDVVGAPGVGVGLGVVGLGVGLPVLDDLSFFLCLPSTVVMAAMTTRKIWMMMRDDNFIFAATLYLYVNV